jgi:hypothetical protein
MQNWLLQLRRQGIAVLLIHHAGTNGRQRGTSRREDALDTVIALRRPDDYSNLYPALDFWGAAEDINSPLKHSGSELLFFRRRNLRFFKPNISHY